MARLKPCVTVEPSDYELVKESARSKWGIKKGNIKRWIKEAIDEKLEREKESPLSKVI